ncbi:hypothetical protein GCM10010965_08720 [Caldalkalibacillus thermarum]|uniref:EAL domain-containing protein n=1 Tax=Caldalkalibacillus thermarum TaxID=296745 RepID=UPI0016644212|nr:EAL domain-containing protein [Caldalkalibacillus thermarum]GGK17958.1 hypothetical protein GCM10010965_08720 [Caldalkalibacillus thermarum]
MTGHDLELELTEHTMVDKLEQVAEVMDQLKQLGVVLALDDFGTGYSSLHYLRRLKLDKLKIDRSFIEGLPADEEQEALVKAMLSVAHKLGMTVVAEGIETKEQLNVLRDWGCQLGQGYYLSRPLSVESLVDLMRNS